MKFIPKVRALIFGLGVGLFLLLFAGASVEPEVTKFQVSFWDMTKTYECKGKFPDGSTFNLNSKDDQTYCQWIEKIKIAWQASQEPPDLPILYETDDYAVRDPNDGNLVLEWKADDVRVTVTKKNLPALVDSTKKMQTIFAGMP